jgi:hypothetical protein
MENLELNLENYETEDIQAALDILEDEKISNMTISELIAVMMEELKIEEETRGLSPLLHSLQEEMKGIE